MKRILLLGLALVLALAPWASAQVTTSIYGSVADESGARLPGAIVTLAGGFGSRSTTTSSNGEFRFVNLDTGAYKVTAGLTGFTTVTREVRLRSGENVTLDYALKVSPMAESVTVTGETPIVDPKKRGTATTMTNEELQNVPSSRDPWGVLKNVPGVLLDRVNIAGNENGQQAAVAGKGSTSDDKMWSLDGVNITDMSATGASPTYFDFEAFQEINVSTGGNELQVQGGGIGINLVTKRGTNTFHGSARYYFADGDWSSGNVPGDLAGDPRLQGNDKADRVNEITDWGFDLGGPIVKDRLWFYGTFGRQDIKAFRLTQTPDDTILDSFNAKVNWAAAEQTMVSGFWFNGKKQKFGRGVGFGVQETDDFLWNQDNAYVDGGPPGGLWKLQVDHTFSPSFFVSAKAAYYDTGFGLFPRGGPDQNFTVDYVAGDAIGSYETYQAIRPQKIFNVDGSYFFGGMGGNHELKFGFGYRDLKTFSSDLYSGDGLGGFINAVDDTLVWVLRNGITEYGGKYASAYFGDVFTKDRMTVNVGVRWDLQTARNSPSSVAASSSFPELLPQLEFAGNDSDVIRWNDISPRIGLSYALDAQRKTVLRAAFSRYADQLSFGDVAGGTGENPVGVSLLAYGWTDANGDRMVQPGEVDLGNFLYSSNVDPNNPGAVGETTNKVDRELKAKHDNEVILGIDRELAPNLAVGAAFTYRRATDWQWRPRLAGACSGEPTRATCPIIGAESYTLVRTDTLNGLPATSFAPPGALVTAGRGGRIRTNRDGYYTNFKGLELTATKRLSNRWMGRMALSFNDWTEHWEDGVTPTTFLGNPTRLETDPLVQGGQVALLSGGSGKASFYSSVKWQLYANALVQLPWTMEISGAVFAKQGGPFPNSVRMPAGGDGTLSVLASPEVDADRYPNVLNVDMRLAKNVRIGRAGLTISAEAFNVLNNDVVLARFRWGGASFNRIEEILSPRTFRLGGRFTF